MNTEQLSIEDMIMQCKRIVAGFIKEKYKMKKYIIILFSMLLLAGISVDAQIKPIKRQGSSKPKTENLDWCNIPAWL